MKALVPYECPKHGWLTDTSPLALVECVCGVVVDAEGRTDGAAWSARRKRVRDREMKRRQRAA